MWKGDNAGNQHFLLSHNVFYSYSIRDRNYDMSWFNVDLSGNTFQLFNKSKILLIGEENADVVSSDTLVWSPVCYWLCYRYSINSLPHMPILGSSKPAANKNMMSKILINGYTIFWLSQKHCGKRRNCSLWAISSFPTMFSKTVCCWCVKMSIYGVKG